MQTTRINRVTAIARTGDALSVRTADCKIAMHQQRCHEMPLHTAAFGGACRMCRADNN